ncbi:MAG: aminotransferase class V-fold PLP-dependent enzyme [Alphaproteobacteria bacterium]
MNIEKIRAETAACDHVLHFNNASASLVPDPVHYAVVEHLELERRLGGYEAAAQAEQQLAHFYDTTAALLNCAPDEIAFVENATRAWDMAFYAIPFRAGDRILTAQAEYASNYLAFLQMAKRRQVVIEVIPNDAAGQLSLDALTGMMDERVKLIAITHVPTQGGLVNPVAEVGRIARRHDVLFLLDACQSVGQMPIDVAEIGCDMLSATGRKFLRGPRGTGFLYVRKSLITQLEPPFIDLHAANWTDLNSFEIRRDARRFENWESFVAGKIGLTAAIDYARDLGLANIRTRVNNLAVQLRAELARMPNMTVHDLGIEKSGIVTFTATHETSTAVYRRLRDQGINTSVSPMNYARLDLTRRGLTDLVRASVHYFNTEAEIDRFCHSLANA